VRQWVNDYLAVDGRHLLVSSLSILECLSFPKKHANHRLIIEYETFFATVIYSSIALILKTHQISRLNSDIISKCLSRETRVS
jgi:hypothetical protein